MSNNAFQKRLVFLNEECKDCQEEYRRKGLIFNPRACGMCPIGVEVHKLGLELSEAERNFGERDWTSFSNQDLYKG